MRRYWMLLIILVCLLLCGGVVFGGQTGVDIQSYHITMKVEPENDLLRLSVTMELTKSDNLDEFMVLFTSFANIQSIKAKDRATDGGWVNMLYRAIDGDTVFLGVHHELLYSTDISVQFEYVLAFGDISDRLALYREHRWYPMILGDIAIYEFSADLPDDYIFISTGEPVETNNWSQDDNSKVNTKVPVSKFPVVIARKGLYVKYEVEDEFTGRSLILYTLSLNDEGQGILGSIVAGLFEYLHDLYGEYRHQNLVLLENHEIKGVDVSSGMIMFGNHVIENLQKGQPQMLHTAVAQQWFGSGAFAEIKGKGYCFFTISLPQYLSMLYLRDAEDEAAFEREVNSALSQYKPLAGTDADIPVIDITELHSRQKARIIYGKGPYILDQLRRGLGDKDFVDFISRLYGEFNGRVMTYDGFMNALRKADRSKSIAGRVRLMLSTTGMP